MKRQHVFFNLYADQKLQQLTFERAEERAMSGCLHRTLRVEILDDEDGAGMYAGKAEFVTAESLRLESKDHERAIRALRADMNGEIEG